MVIKMMCFYIGYTTSHTLCKIIQCCHFSLKMIHSGGQIENVNTQVVATPGGIREDEGEEAKAEMESVVGVADGRVLRVVAEVRIQFFR